MSLHVFRHQLPDRAHWNTASEVATMKLMDALGIPVPKVLTWSSRGDNQVGTEYIIMEKAKGIPSGYSVGNHGCETARGPGFRIG